MAGIQSLEDNLSAPVAPALLIGNGVNRYGNTDSSSWEDLLDSLAHKQGMNLDKSARAAMSNTEFFDILDLTRPKESRDVLQKEFFGRMKSWRPGPQHALLVNWAKRHQAPIITVNFDENLSNSVDVRFIRQKEGFTDYYPWRSYFADEPISDAKTSFAIWHAHGMARYFRSIRLGLTHYMGSVHRARDWVYNKNGIRRQAKSHSGNWPGNGTWLQVFFFCPIVIIGFGFSKDETFFRWLFLERARLHKLKPDWSSPAWFVDTGSVENQSRRLFLEKLGINYIEMPSYDSIYDAAAWTH